MIPYTGRKKIVTDITSDELMERDYLAAMYNTAKQTHDVNAAQINYLTAYHKGIQPILAKEKDVRPEINNITVLNHAMMITRTINGYFLGNDIQYVKAKGIKQDEIEKLNDFVTYEGKHAVDREIGQNQSICGVGYRIILSDNDDEVPFEDRSLEPATTFVVYSNDIANKPVAGVTYYSKLDVHGYEIGTHAYIYTEYGVFDVLTDISNTINTSSTINFTPYNVGGVPIIEYPNNTYRMGDWEHVLSLMDDINALQSGRMDDIEQVVESLLVFINADIDADTYAEMRASGIVALKNTTNNKSSVETISNPLDQTGMNIFAKELQELLYALTGIPSRNDSSKGGGDTGQAVELRDGWADLEIVARGKEALFKRSEKRSLKIILSILKNKLGIDLALSEVDVKFTRNKNQNLLTKVQAYQTLLLTKSISPADALTVVDLVSDVAEYVTRGEAYWGKLSEIDKEETVVEPQEVVE